jgi:serine/threonine protein kinase
MSTDLYKYLKYRSKYRKLRQLGGMLTQSRGFSKLTVNGKDYAIEKTLGVGGFGRTYLLLDESRSAIVLKQPKANRPKELVISFVKECQFLKRLEEKLSDRHFLRANIPKFISCVVRPKMTDKGSTTGRGAALVLGPIEPLDYKEMTDEFIGEGSGSLSTPFGQKYGANIAIITEYSECGTMDTIDTSGHNPSDLFNQMYSLIVGLNQISVVHGDIKQENLLLCSQTDGHGSKIMMIDFNLSRHFDSEKYHQYGPEEIVDRPIIATMDNTFPFIHQPSPADACKICSDGRCPTGIRSHLEARPSRDVWFLLDLWGVITVIYHLMTGERFVLCPPLAADIYSCLMATNFWCIFHQYISSKTPSKENRFQELVDRIRDDEHTKFFQALLASYYRYIVNDVRPESFVDLLEGKET